MRGFPEDLSAIVASAAAAILLAGLFVWRRRAIDRLLDSLTGLPGRRALDRFLRQLTGGGALALVNIDYFKRFNEAYGRDAGDQLIRKVAAQLTAAEGGGRVFRYDGDEFAVVFPRRSRKAALPHLEAVRALMEADCFRLRGPNRPAQKPREHGFVPRGGRKVHVTVSIGVAEFSEKLASPDLVVEAAGKALGRAKERGRNQVQAA
jgi:diguanylate cyclase (GGDEF)-like protein